MTDTETVELDRLKWAEVMLALAKLEADEDVGEVARDRAGNIIDSIKGQVTITQADLLELQEVLKAEGVGQDE